MRVEGRRRGPDADWIHLPDPIADAIKALSARLAAIEERLAELDGQAPQGEVKELRPKQGPSPTGRLTDSLAAMGERTRHAPGTFSWTDLGTTDAAGAKAFYGGLFGWELEDMPVPDAPVHHGPPRRQGRRRTVRAVCRSARTAGVALLRHGRGRRRDREPRRRAGGDGDLGAVRRHGGGTNGGASGPDRGGVRDLAARPEHRCRAGQRPGRNNDESAQHRRSRGRERLLLGALRLAIRSAARGAVGRHRRGGAAVLGDLQRRAPERRHDAALPGGAGRAARVARLLHQRRPRRKRCPDRGARGQVMVPPMRIQSGRIAVAQDPQGAVFALFEGEVDD